MIYTLYCVTEIKCFIYKHSNSSKVVSLNLPYFNPTLGSAVSHTVASDLIEKNKTR